MYQFELCTSNQYALRASLHCVPICASLHCVPICVYSTVNARQATQCNMSVYINISTSRLRVEYLQNIWREHVMHVFGREEKILYISASSSWRRRGLKRVPRSNLDQLLQREFLPTCSGTILYCNSTWSVSHAQPITTHPFS